LTLIFTQNYNDDNTFLKAGKAMIYLDYSATTPVSERALEIYGEVARKHYGNASSLHDVGGVAQQILEASRQALADLFQGEARGLYFTSGGSESSDLAIRSLLKANHRRGKHIMTTQVEHASVANTFVSLEEEGYRVTYLPVDEFGVVKRDVLEASVTQDTALVSIVHANSEIGTVQPIEEIASWLHERHILFHTDAVQSFGKLPIQLKDAPIHALSLSSHKIYGPKGVGAAYIAPEVSWLPVIPGATHEKGFRHGTVNVPGIAGFATAAQEMHGMMKDEVARWIRLRDRLKQGIEGTGWDVAWEGHPEQRLPHHLALRIRGMEGQYAMLEFNRYGVAVSTGSACHVGQQAPSSSMKAIGRTDQEARELIRMTVGRFTTEQEIDQTIEVFDRICKNYFGSRASS
jgi:cysteine desulfurase